MTADDTVRYSPAHLARLLGLPEPTSEQAAVIAAPLAPLAVVAGAGSGKSETMAARLVWLVANGMVHPERVLGLTFTRKAAAELGQRVRARLTGLRRAGLGTVDRQAGAAEHAPDAGQPGGREHLSDGEQPAEGLDGEPNVSTYHAYAARLVADHALREALEPTLRLVTPAVAWQIAARVVGAYAGPMDAVTWSPPEVTAAVLALAGELAEHLREPGEVYGAGQWLARARAVLPGHVTAKVRRICGQQRAREQLLPLVVAYAEAKAARGVMDYGDQVVLAARIAARHPEVGAAERARYPVVLLDEFQDTSHAQLVLLRALFGGGHPVTAVGDPCQSIYGWRGASAGNLARFTHQFPTRSGRPARATVLSTSFRNTERVLDVAARLREGLASDLLDVPQLVPPPSRTGRGMALCALHDTAAGESAWVAEQVAGLLSLPVELAPDGVPWPDPGHGPLQPSGIAVLCRKRSQFPALRCALEARGIPVEVVGLGGLLTVPEVADVVATLRVLHDAAGSVPLARLLTGPRWRIGPRDLMALGRRARELARDHGRAAPGTAAAGGDAPGTGASGPDAAGRGSAGLAAAGTGAPAPDALASAVTDLTVQPGSLVEALDDLGDRRAYSPTGYARLSALAAEMRMLRAHVGRPLSELVGEVERVLGLDVEVAAQPGRDPAGARADLDAFGDAAAAFADGENEPTLGAFLAYLSAAESEEFGLEPAQPSGANAVTLTTVHAAKGLQWDAVVVPGLSAGQRASVFPARPRVATRWTENPRLVPFALRGDASDLPALPDLTTASLAGFDAACAARDLAEERRLAYVAVTRAAFWVACSGYWWGEGTHPLGPSVFLTEVREACETGVGTVVHWAPAPEEDAQNPALTEPATAHWPAEESGSRVAAVREAAAMVEEALAAQAMATHPLAAHATAAPARPLAGDAAAGVAGAGHGTAGVRAAGSGLAPGQLRALSAADRELARAWVRDTSLLLAELAERREEAGTVVGLPGRLTVSSLVTMAADPARLAGEIRRPMPRPPARHARRGTAFHRWLEERFSQQRLIDPLDLPGAADDPTAGLADAAGRDGADAADLLRLRKQFEAGEWGNRWPVEVEVPFETPVAGRVVAGRIDAVFASPGGHYDVLDWKTGDPPASQGEFQAAAVQLAAYRLAWSRLAGVPLRQVGAGFHYVRHDLTLRPADLLDEAGLAALVEGVPQAGR
ncbi:MAG TPA: ATP-dependent DNA helicase [Streptosporangiaceae bacterium]|nr:ATP-dependent DNA helicase [Streptosporangiaceae bacterium]